MDRKYFAESPPDIQVRGDLFFIVPEGGNCEIAVTPHTLGEFVAKANRALAKWRKGGAKVVRIARH